VQYFADGGVGTITWFQVVMVQVSIS